jgi:RNA polymerase sigma-70 factor (ECF subfamily)
MTAHDDQSPLDLARLRLQDPEEFARLVPRFTPLVSGLAQTMGLRSADIDDALADSFAAVYRALPRFQGRSELSTWVYRIAARTILKTRQRYPRSPDPDSATANAADPSPSPSDRAASADSHRRVWAAVAALEPRQAMAVELYYRQSFSVQQIADVLDCPVNTVKTHLARARTRLRHTLADLQISL